MSYGVNIVIHTGDITNGGRILSRLDILGAYRTMHVDHFHDHTHFKNTHLNPRPICLKLATYIFLSLSMHSYILLCQPIQGLNQFRSVF